MPSDTIKRLELPNAQVAKLGRKVEHDPRSKDYPFARLLPRKLTLKTILHRHDGPVLDQGNVGACTGYSGADIMNYSKYAVGRKRAKQSRDYLFGPDAMGLYRRATILDGFPGSYPPDDTGSSGLAVAKAMIEHGYITSYRWIFSPEELQQALMVTPVMAGTWWFSDMFNPVGRLAKVTPTGDKVGGHEYTIFGQNFTGKYYTCLNHWGPNWGARGIFRVSFDDMHALLKDDGDVVVPVV